jgi:hypothetical protein
MYNQKLELTRTLGFEIECFVQDAPTYTDDWGDEITDFDDISINHCEIGEDGSLYGGDGYAIEAKTDPIRNLNTLEEVWSDLNEYGFNVNQTCGLHIHVDTSDFNGNDKARLLRFAIGIEHLMFALVDPSRSGRHGGENEYCIPLHKSWRKIFRRSYINQNIHDNTYRSLSNFIQAVRDEKRNSGTSDRIWNGRYQWLNAEVGHCPTSEFRIFSSTTDMLQAQKFGMLAYHIIETVKHSTVNQLQFIIKSIYEQTSVEAMFDCFFESIGLDSEFRPSILNDDKASYLETKFCEPNRMALLTNVEEEREAM